VRKDDPHRDRGRLREHLPGQLPAYAPCDSGPQSGWALNWKRLLFDLLDLYDRTTLSRLES
jgi:hypothetical protein